MGKRIFLFVATNVAIIVTLSILLRLLGVAGYIRSGGGLDFFTLAVFCTVWGMGGAFISLLMSRWLAKRAMGVELINGQTGNAEFDGLYNTIANLTRQANLPMPEVGIYESEEVNAFATGPSKNRSLVAVSSGLLRTMDQNQIEGVLGHEVTHIANGDMVTMTLIQGVVNAFAMFFARIVAYFIRQAMDSRMANMVAFLVQIVLEIGLSFLGLIIIRWFSRHREFRADAGGAVLAGRGNMIGALKRLQETQQLVDNSHPALANFKIAGGPGSLFASHPPLEVRIAALEAGEAEA
jgi:heat shock protein HtpX